VRLLLKLLENMTRIAAADTCDASPEAYEWSGVPAQGDLLIHLPRIAPSGCTLRFHFKALAALAALSASSTYFLVRLRRLLLAALPSSLN